MGHLYRETKKRADGTVWESPTYTAAYYKNGELVRQNTRTGDEKKAQRMMTRWEGDPNALSPKVQKVLIDELAKDYVNDYTKNHRKTVDQAKKYKERILYSFGGRRASSITKTEIDEYQIAMQEAGYANGTINRDISALHRMYQLGVEAGKVQMIPVMHKLKENNRRTGFFGDVEHLAVMEKAPFWLQVLSAIAKTYGFRKEEVTRLQWPQIDFANREIRLWAGDTKNDEPRVIVMTEQIYQMLLKLRKETVALEKEKGIQILNVFHRNGRPVKDFRGLWKKLCADAKVTRLFHDYRRTAVRNMELAGVPRSTAMTITGHKTETIYKRYAIQDRRSMKDATARIEALQNGSEGPVPDNEPKSGQEAA